MTFCFFPNSKTQNLHYQFQDPTQSNFSRKIRIGWTGYRDELSTRFQHTQGFFERLLVQAIQNYIVIMKGSFEIVFPVIDDDIRTEVLHQIEIRRARCRSYDRANMLRQLNCKCSYTT